MSDFSVSLHTRTVAMHMRQRLLSGTRLLISLNKRMSARTYTQQHMHRLPGCRSMRPDFYQFLLLSVFVMAILSGFNSAQADSLFELGSEAQIEIYQTTDDIIDDSQLNKPEFISQFKPYRQTSFNFGMYEGDLWFRISLPSDHQFNYLEIDNPYLDIVRLYSRHADGSFHMQEAGDSMPFDSRDIKYRTFVFELDNSLQSTNVHYLKIRSKGAVHFLVNVWDEDGFLEYTTRSQGLIGIYYGLLLVMAIYNLLIFFSIRESTHLYYVIYTLVFGLFFGAVSGVSFQYLWPENHQWAQLSSSFFTGLVIFSAFLFSRDFLQTRKNSPILDRLILALMALSVFQIGLVLFGDLRLAAGMGIALGICLPPVIWWSAMHCWIKGFRPARFIILAWTFFLITIFTSGLMYAGLVEANFFTVYGMQIGSGLEIILLSFALADKMSLLKQGRQNLQAIYTNHLETYSHVLEKKVSERTGELQEAMEIARKKNLELELINQHLTDLATHDGLTGLLNHHTFIEQFKHVIEDARRYRYSLVVMMIDLDHFKKINDTFGHLTGNDVLRSVATIFDRAVRESDLAARYGGEEFTLVLTRTSLTEAMGKAEVIRQQVKDLRLENAPSLNLTISIGLAAFDPSNQNTDYNALLSQSDKALYDAKQQGRDRVCSASRRLSIVTSSQSPQNQA